MYLSYFVHIPTVIAEWKKNFRCDKANKEICAVDAATMDACFNASCAKAEK